MRISLVFISFFFSFVATAQLKVDTSYTSEHLVDKILSGQGIRVGNIKLNGHKIGLAYFTTDSAVIGMKSGILLSTGNVYDATGENNTPGKSGALFTYKTNTKSFKKSRRGDRDLNKISKGRTYDVNILEFDFVPFHNKVSFNYCFASEEYKEYVGSRFNDVFAFIVTGPKMRKTNLAVLPNTKTPITINNVNHKKNKQYYIDNDFFVNLGLLKNVKYQLKTSPIRRVWIWLFKKKKNKNSMFYIKDGEKNKLNQILVNNFQYDGFTTVFSPEFHVTPFKKYHLKIAIGDVGDAIFDSGVFLEEGTFSAVKDTSIENFINYQDISTTLDFDSIFGNKEYIDSVFTEESFDITNVYFNNNSSEIIDTAKIHLKKLAEYLNRNTQLKCLLWGYTDNKGSKKYNQKLSENRAISVMNYIIELGVSSDRFEYQGNNFEAPVSNNKTEIGRSKNRRVEILIVEE
jgi:outer membrane protein OmpA-like peptidoglycan-associated protein